MDALLLSVKVLVAEQEMTKKLFESNITNSPRRNEQPDHSTVSNVSRNFGAESPGRVQQSELPCHCERR